MNLNIALLVAASIPTRTEGDVRAAYQALEGEVDRWQHRNLPAPPKLWTAYQTVARYLLALEGVAA
jgi:hypothetical protein